MKMKALPKFETFNILNPTTQYILFNVQRSMYRNFIPFDIFPIRCNVTQFIYFCKTAVHVSGAISTHHQGHTQLYIQYLVLVNCNG